MTFTDPVLAAMAGRRSLAKVGAGAPSDEELLELLEAVTPVADHKALRPWRLITLRGEDRLRLGEALDAAADESRAPGEVNPKPLRADLLIAVVLSPKPHPVVPEWEQLATAAGAGHLLSLALWRAGWGVMWRTGLLVDAKPVRALHRLDSSEKLLGWLYVGSITPELRDRLDASPKRQPDAQPFLSSLP